MSKTTLCTAKQNNPWLKPMTLVIKELDISHFIDRFDHLIQVPVSQDEGALSHHLHHHVCAKVVHKI